MKTKKSLPTIVSLMIFLALAAFSSIAHAATYTVGPSGNYTKIKDAIAAASSGDTVIVEDGSYGDGDVDFGGKNITLTSLLAIDGNTDHITNTVINEASRKF